MGVKYQTNSFLSGILSPKLKARVDIPEYQQGLEECENFLVGSTGYLYRRPGTYFCKEVKDSDYEARILPHYAEGQAYVIELNNAYVRMYLAAGKGFSDYDHQDETPWGAEDVSQIHFVQQGTDLYVTSIEYTPRLITKIIDPTEDGGMICGGAYDGSSVYVLQTVDTKKLYSSTDLSTWTLRQTMSEIGSGGVAYGDSKFIACPGGTTIYASADGSAWSTESTPRGGYCVEYGNSLFLIGSVSSGDPKILTRPSGDAAGSGSWTERDITGASGYSTALGIAYDGSTYFCCVTIGGYICLSTDGTTWAAESGSNYEDDPLGTGQAIAYGDGVFVAAGEDSSGCGAVLYNDDVGTNTWKSVQVTEDSGSEWEIRGVAYGAGLFVGVCYNGRTYYSSNGVSWTQGVVPIEARTGTVEIVFINDTFFIFGKKGYSKSDDGINWSFTWTIEEPTFTGGDGTFDEAGEYPKCVALHEGRLIFSCNKNNLLTTYGSEIGDLTDFDTSAGTNDDDPFEFTLTQNLGSEIVWIEGQDLLYLATDRAIWKVGSLTDVLSPTTVFYPKQLASYPGRDYVQPCLVGSLLVYPQAPGSVLRIVEYSHERHKYFTPDISGRAQHLFTEKVKRLAFQMTPDPLLWAVTDDGNCLISLFDPTSGLNAWSYFTTEGNVEDIAIVPGDEQDQVYLLVKRTINGSTKRYIEYVVFDEWEDAEDAFYVDCGITWEGKDAETITAITKSATCEITFEADTGFANDELIRISDVTDMTEVNSNTYMLKNKSGNTFDLYEETGTTQIDSSGFSAAGDDGEAEQVKKTIDDLDHLEGEEVAVFADGSTLASETVASGEITIDAYAHIVHVGLGYTSTVKPMPFPGARDRYKRISALYVDFYKTMGGEYGDNEDDMISFKETASGMVTASEKLSFPGAIDRDVQPTIQQTNPQPMTILGIIAEVQA